MKNPATDSRNVLIVEDEQSIRDVLVELFDIEGNVGRVAQSVEQRIENPRVTGSIPVPATNFTN